MRRSKAINSYSEEQLESLPRPIVTDVYLALKYIHSQISCKVTKHRCAHSCQPPTTKPASPPLPSTADKAVSTQDPAPPLRSTETDTEIGTLKADVGLQVTASLQVLNIDDKRKIREINAKWERKQQQFEAISAERELAEKQRLEEAAKEAEKAQLLKLQAHKSSLISRHLHYVEAKRKRKEMMRAGEANYRKVRASLPLFEQLAGADKLKKASEIEAYQMNISERRLRMRSIDPSEFSQHKDKYEETRETLLSNRRKAREQRLRHIQKHNKSLIYYQSPLYELNEEERRSQEALEELREKMLREALCKGKAYGKLAMEKYPPHVFLPKSPSVFTSKTQESPVVHSARTPVMPSNPRSGLFSTRRRYKTLRRPQPAPPSPLPVPDYNTERRLFLSNSLLTDQSSPIFHYQSRHFSPSTDAETLQNEANRLSIEARKGDIQVRRLDRTPILQSQACDRVAAMYLDSIKARLELARRVES